MSGEPQNFWNGYAGARAPNGLGVDQGTAEVGTSGGAQFGQPPAMHFTGPATINVFCYPGSYSVTTRFKGNPGRTFGDNRQVRFASDARYYGPRNPSSRMPQESTPYPRSQQSPDATVAYEGSPKYFQP